MMIVTFNPVTVDFNRKTFNDNGINLENGILKHTKNCSTFKLFNWDVHDNTIDSWFSFTLKCMDVKRNFTFAFWSICIEPRTAVWADLRLVALPATGGHWWPQYQLGTSPLRSILTGTCLCDFSVAYCCNE